MPVNSSIVRRSIDAIAASRAAVASSPLPTYTAERALGLSHAPGDRVVDAVTGHVVEVVNGYTNAEVVFAARPKVD